MSDSEEVFGGGWRRIASLAAALAWLTFFLAMLIATLTEQYPIVLVVFAAVCWVGGVVYVVITPNRATLGPDNKLTFRTPLRRQVVHLEEVRTIRGKRGSEGGWWWKFSFDHGSATLHGKAGEALANRLKKLNPAIPVFVSEPD